MHSIPIRDNRGVKVSHWAFTPRKKNKKKTEIRPETGLSCSQPLCVRENMMRMWYFFPPYQPRYSQSGAAEGLHISQPLIISLPPELTAQDRPRHERERVMEKYGLHRVRKARNPQRSAGVLTVIKHSRLRCGLRVITAVKRQSVNHRRHCEDCGSQGWRLCSLISPPIGCRRVEKHERSQTRGDQSHGEN